MKAQQITQSIINFFVDLEYAALDRKLTREEAQMSRLQKLGELRSEGFMQRAEQIAVLEAELTRRAKRGEAIADLVEAIDTLVESENAEKAWKAAELKRQFNPIAEFTSDVINTVIGLTGLAILALSVYYTSLVAINATYCEGNRSDFCYEVRDRLEPIADYFYNPPRK